MLFECSDYRSDGHYLWSIFYFATVSFKIPMFLFLFGCVCVRTVFVGVFLSCAFFHLRLQCEAIKLSRPETHHHLMKKKKDKKFKHYYSLTGY